MFDDTEEATSLPLGLRVHSRQAREVLPVLRDDLMHAASLSAEGGFEDWEMAEQVVHDITAYLALMEVDASYDVVLDDDYDGAEGHAVERLVRCAIQICNVWTPDLTRYGYSSNDPENDRYERLGVWVDWTTIDRLDEECRIWWLDSPDEAPDEKAVVAFREKTRKNRHGNETKPNFVMFEDDDGAMAWSTLTGELLWEV